MRVGERDKNYDNQRMTDSVSSKQTEGDKLTDRDRRNDRHG